MGQSKTPSLSVDPALQTEQTQAAQDLSGAMQTQTQGDMASLMARYGTQLAMAGAVQLPLATAGVNTGLNPGSRAA